jgi:hypothetical protein
MGSIIKSFTGDMKLGKRGFASVYRGFPEQTKLGKRGFASVYQGFPEQSKQSCSIKRVYKDSH